MAEKITVGNLLFHSVHGLCRVQEVIPGGGAAREGGAYSLVPNRPNPMSVRFVIPAAGIAASGFHAPVTVREANDILNYLKDGGTAATPSAGPFTETWMLASSILTISQNPMESKDPRKRQALERSARGLVRELAFVLNITSKEAAGKVRRSLERTLKVHPQVLIALNRALED